MDDLISRQAAIDALKNRWKKTRNYKGIGDDIAEECELYLKQLPSAQPERKKGNEKSREELVVFNNELRELRAENEKLKAELQDARLAEEHNSHVAEENQLKYELRYRDGVIYGMKYALKCNGVSGGELDRRYE